MLLGAFMTLHMDGHSAEIACFHEYCYCMMQVPLLYTQYHPALISSNESRVYLSEAMDNKQ